MFGHREQSLTQQCAVGDDRAALGCQFGQLGDELVGVGPLGRSTGMSCSSANRATGDGDGFPRRPAAASGRVSTATTSWRGESIEPRKRGYGGLGSAGEDDTHRASLEAPHRGVW